ncbi:MAG TPA: hypothetical protein DCL48_15785, partial [Alphaproteobacteria bacterium]|nr:hypothetical protein [Alphaproteobacteria bacterium]
PSLSADADAIIATADRIPAWFPAGSAQKPTEAAPAIWTDPEGFAASAVAMRKMAEALKVKVEAGEPAGIAAQFRLLAQSCKSCHQGYRIIPK